MKNIFIYFVFAFAAVLFASQTKDNIYTTRTGHIWFYSKAPLEDIEAHNRQVSSSLNPVNGEVAFLLLVKGFEFEKALMQEHFNENYLESDKYPKSTFKGKITNIKKVNFRKNGSYDVEVIGDLTMHGVTKSVAVPGTITVKNGEVTAAATFPVRVKDFKITIPALVKDKIAEVVDVNVEMQYKLK